MAKKKLDLKFDWKQLLLQHGERIGLGVAGALCALMVLPLLWFMAFGQSSKAVVEELAAPTKQLKDKQASAQPVPATDLPPDSQTDTKVTLAKAAVPNASSYQNAQFFAPTVYVDTTKRRMPVVLRPSEGALDFTWAEVSSFIFRNEQSELMVLKMDNSGPGGAAPAPDNNNLKPPSGFRMPGRRGSPPPSSYTPSNTYGHEGLKKDHNFEYISWEKLLDDPNAHPAQTAKPLRMAIICANFPYREQIREFQQKLNLKSPADVLTDERFESNGEQKLPAFQFLGVNLERRLVDAQGRPLPNSPWEPINLEKTYAPWVSQCGIWRSQPDSKDIKSVSFPGLTYKRLPLLPKCQYPAVESKLPSVNKTIAGLDKAPNTEKPKNPFTGAGEGDLFSGGDDSAAKTSPGGTPVIKTAPADGRNPAPDPNDINAFPEFGLIRLFDVTIEPGKFYQYRVQVRMANPNYGSKNVAAPNYASSKEPLLSEWFAIPQFVAVPPEYHIYNVDQKEDDMRTGVRWPFLQRADEKIDPAKQAVFQVHKWIEYHDGKNMPVGEWAVAERVPALRGEYIAKAKQRVLIPYWRHTAELFDVLADSSVKKDPRKPMPLGVGVDFGPPQGEDLILVDFEGGDMKYARVVKPGEKPEIANVTDKAGFETLILSPEGKLLAHETWVDKADPNRTSRLVAWRNRLVEVFNGLRSSGSGGDPSNPFKNK